MAKKKNALGRGLSALLENEETDVTSKNDPTSGSRVVGAVSSIPLDRIEANPFQPRTEFEEEALKELAASIKELGIIQPVTVRKLGYDKYQLISGERRLRASEMAGLEEVPAFIRIANDQSMLEMALVENIQREELDAIEIAISYKRLVDECKLTQEALSERVGKKRSTITNYLRLLKLPPEIQAAIREKKISMGHARTLINIEDEEKQLEAFKQILEKSLSVREVEKLVRGFKTGSGKKRQPAELSNELKKLKKDLSEYFETKVDVKANKSGKGQIVLKFNSDEELEVLREKLNI